MNQAEQILICTTCNSKMEFLDFEKTMIAINPEGSPIGTNRIINAINLHMYCPKCQCNKSNFIHYQDERSIIPFIEDVKKLSPKFKKHKYRDLP